MHILISGGHMERVEGIFKALADSTRLRILNLLLREDACVCELGSALGLPQPLVSRHLACLRNAGLVLDHREGMRVRYSLILKGELGGALESLLRKAFSCGLIYQEDIHKWDHQRGYSWEPLQPREKRHDAST
jgi:ArsR family transcriptional regulator, arsenate/arsenite/antimonite-responsive transcriptional repressor